MCEITRRKKRGEAKGDGRDQLPSGAHSGERRNRLIAPLQDVSGRARLKMMPLGMHAFRNSRADSISSARGTRIEVDGARYYALLTYAAVSLQ